MAEDMPAGHTPTLRRCPEFVSVNGTRLACPAYLNRDAEGRLYCIDKPKHVGAEPAESLVGFVRARIAEDRAAAQQAAGDPATAQWEFAHVSYAWEIRSVRKVGHPGYERHHRITLDREGLTDSVDKTAGPHIARHDPARTLTQCAAFEEVVRNHERHQPGEPGYGASRHAVRCLAAIWGDHRDYDPDWAL